MLMDRQDIYALRLFIYLLCFRVRTHKNEHLTDTASNKMVLCIGFLDRQTQFLNAIYSNNVL